MSCAPGPATYRLLDAHVGWDEADVTGLVGFDDPRGVRLAHAGPAADGPTRAELLPWFPDPRLAPGCEPSSWYLLVPDRPGLLRRDACAGRWSPVWPRDCDPGLLRAPVAVAALGHRVAVVDDDRVLVWRREGEQLAGEFRVRGASLVALVPGDEVLVARAGSDRLWRYTSAGVPRGVLRTGTGGEIVGLRTGPDRTVWLLTDDGGRLTIHRGRPFEESTVDELAALPPSSLSVADDDGFCLREAGPDGDAVTTCWTWRGKPRDDEPVARTPFATSGVVLTEAIDSGISRCRWHRVRVEADVPAGTAVTVELVVSENGEFDDSDWQAAPPGVRDLLVDQPPGRYLHLRLRLTGDGTATPVVRRVRLDFPRVTSADLLPPAYRQDPAADDFTERFLSLFDATLADLDRVIERYPALLDAAGVPDQALPWLAGLLGLSFESGWDEPTRRALLAAAPELYRRRGTPGALRKAVKIVFGVEPVLDELPGDRSWAQLGVSGAGTGPGLGGVRLFSRSSARFRVGRSALGTAPLRGYGDPGTDPLTAHAHRFRVRLPAGGGADEQALRRLVQRQAPAHTIGSVGLGGRGFVVGVRSAVGVDTAFVPLPPPVLGGRHPVRLGRDGVLRPGRRGQRRGTAVGVVSAVGVHTQMS
jgi:phage tail-like protein